MSHLRGNHRRGRLCTILAFLLGSGGAVAAPINAPTYDSVDLAAVVPPFRVTGTEVFAGFGWEMAAGDMNGDGLDELAVGEPFATPLMRFQAGLVHVLDHGRLHGSIDLMIESADSLIQGQVGADAQIDSIGDQTGQSLVFGDFNGDGFDDLAIGVPDALRGPISDVVARPTVFIVWGSASLAPTVDLAAIGSGFTEIVAAPEHLLQGGSNSGFGFDVAAGDFDGDGLDDLMVGSPFFGSSGVGFPGRVHVIYGRTDFAELTQIDIDAMPDGNRLVINGTEDGAALGWTLTAGDFDGDGLDDCIASAPDGGSGFDGGAFIVYGRTDRPGPITLTEQTSGPFELTVVRPDAANFPGARLGESLATGYHNSDLFADLLIGAPGDNGGGFAGTAYVIHGGARTGSIGLAGALGGRFTRFDANSTGDEAGWAGAFADIDGDGLEDPVIAAHSDQSAGPQSPLTERGAVYIPLSDGSLATSARMLNGSDTDIWSFAGPSANYLLGDTVISGGLDGDVTRDIFLGTPFGNQPMTGEVLGFPAINTHPRLILATAIEQNSIDQVLSPGDAIFLTFDHSITVPPAFPPAVLQAGDFFLSNAGATLGTDATIQRGTEPTNVLVVTLGSTFANLIVAGDDPAASTAIDLGLMPSVLMTDPTTGAAAVDGGVAGVHGDTLVDLRWRYAGIPATVGAAGGTVGLVQNPPGGPQDYQYSHHSFSLPPGALDPGETIDYQFQGLSGGVSSQGLTSGVRIISSNPERIFNIPGTLSLEYLPEDIDFSGGQVEGLVRILPVETGFSFLTQRLDDSPPIVPAAQSSTDNTVESPIGTFITSFSYEAGTFATLPVNPIEERSLWLLPSSGDTAVVTVITPAATGPFLEPANGSAYFRSDVEFPGQMQVAVNTPGATQVTIRTATIFERTTPIPQVGANVFPSNSAALFVIRTQVDGSPVTYAGPVNINAQYFSRSDPTISDVVDFHGTLGDETQMRIVRSRVDVGLGPNFQFIGGTQTVDTATGVVHIDGAANLTDANGLAAWGVVVDSSVPPPVLTLDALVNHILGVSELTGFLLEDADRRDDDVIDVADVVSFINNP